MPKYRILTIDELVNFEKEFIDFLVVNGISPDDWIDIKENESEKAEKIISLFSDVILERHLRQITFLEIKSPGYIGAIQCLPEKMNLVALSRTNDKINLMQLNQIETRNLKIHRSEKTYHNQRELELFKLIQKGYGESDGKLFKDLMMIATENIK